MDQILISVKRKTTFIWMILLLTFDLFIEVFAVLATRKSSIYSCDHLSVYARLGDMSQMSPHFYEV